VHAEGVGGCVWGASKGAANVCVGGGMKGRRGRGLSKYSKSEHMQGRHRSLLHVLTPRFGGSRLLCTRAELRAWGAEQPATASRLIPSVPSAPHLNCGAIVEPGVKLVNDALVAQHRKLAAWWGWGWCASSSSRCSGFSCAALCGPMNDWGADTAHTRTPRAEHTQPQRAPGGC
jgi:hypothetical protein